MDYMMVFSTYSFMHRVVSKCPPRDTICSDKTVKNANSGWLGRHTSANTESKMRTRNVGIRILELIFEN